MQIDPNRTLPAPDYGRGCICHVRCMKLEETGDYGLILFVTSSCLIYVTPACFIAARQPLCAMPRYILYTQCDWLVSFTALTPRLGPT